MVCSRVDLDLDLDFIITLPLGLSAFLAERDVNLLYQKKLIGLLVCIHHVCVYCLRKATEAKVVRMGGYLGVSNWKQSIV